MESPFKDKDCQSICEFIKVMSNVDVSSILEIIYNNKNKQSFFTKEIGIIENAMPYMLSNIAVQFNDESYFFYLISIFEYLGINTSKYFNAITPKKDIFNLMYNQSKYFKDVEKRKKDLEYLKEYFFRN